MKKNEKKLKKMKKLKKKKKNSKKESWNINKWRLPTVADHKLSPMYAKD